MQQATADRDQHPNGVKTEENTSPNSDANWNTAADSKNQKKSVFEIPESDPMWIKRQMEIAREWEQKHCPEEPVQEKYEWRRASNDVLKAIRERKLLREALDGLPQEDEEGYHPEL